MVSTDTERGHACCCTYPRALPLQAEPDRIRGTWSEFSCVEFTTGPPRQRCFVRWKREQESSSASASTSLGRHPSDCSVRPNQGSSKAKTALLRTAVRSRTCQAGFRQTATGGPATAHPTQLWVCKQGRRDDGARRASGADG